jgi:nucleotide-binding universal stress UspA family protein
MAATSFADATHPSGESETDLVGRTSSFHEDPMKLERLVVGVDFSAPSVEAARWAANQFAPGAELVLVHVISIPEPPRIVRSRFPRRDLLIDTVREGAEQRLREISRSLNADFVWLEIREGDPAERLANVAAEFSADLIVAGTHGERPGLQEALGTTAEHLVRASTRPVLLVTRSGLTPPSHVIVPVDRSENAVGALRWAGALSRRFTARATAIHVVTAGVASGVLAAAAVVSGVPPIDPRTPLATAEMSDRWLEDAVAAGVPRESATSEVAFGEPTREILSAAERLDADLIVIGRRAEGNFRRAVLGSVVDGVIRGSPCPVLVVPERSKAAS